MWHRCTVHGVLCALRVWLPCGRKEQSCPMKTRCGIIVHCMVCFVSSGYDCHAAGRNRADPWRLHGRYHWGASQEENQPAILRLEMTDSGHRFHLTFSDVKWTTLVILQPDWHVKRWEWWPWRGWDLRWGVGCGWDKRWWVDVQMCELVKCK